MKQSTMKKLVCLVLAVLLAAAALTLTGCSKQDEGKKPETSAAPVSTAAPVTTAAAPVTTEAAPVTTEAVPATTEAAPVTTEAVPVTTEMAARRELGEGEKLFYFDVTFSNGETVSYAIHTDAETVGEALLSLDLIAGDEGQYGLYVTTVDGETLSWDDNQMYWAFYENGEYAMTGVDATAIAEDASYALVATKG